MIYDLEPYSGY
jgi:ABC-type antimicrobial peptide transport system permease subunit